MYYARKIPAAFQKKPEEPQPLPPAAPVSIEAREKSQLQNFFPLPLFLLLELYAKKKGDE